MARNEELLRRVRVEVERARDNLENLEDLAQFEEDVGRDSSKTQQSIADISSTIETFDRALRQRGILKELS